MILFIILYLSFEAANLALFFYISKPIADKISQKCYNQRIFAFFSFLNMPKKDIKNAN